MIIELEVDGELIEVEEKDLNALVDKIRRNRPPDLTQASLDSMTAISHAVASIPMAIKSGISEIKFPQTVAQKSNKDISKITIANIHRGDDRLIKSVELILHRS